MKSKCILSLLSLLFLTACAGPVTQGPQASQMEIGAEAEKQRAFLYNTALRDHARLVSVAWPLEIYNAEFCGDDVAPTLGMTLWNIHTVGRKFRDAAERHFNLGSRLAVQVVAQRSPAAKAGIRSGDIIVAVDGQKIPAGTRARKTALDAIKSAQYKPLAIVIERDGKTLTKTAAPVAACDFDIELDFANPEINAYADGEKISVTRGMLRFAENDNELALVVAHELGHSALTHVGKLRQNAIVGSIGGLAIDALLAVGGVSTGGQFMQVGADIGAAAHSVGFEQEADYVGMYFMERAGFSAGKVANFWRRMAAEGESSITSRSSHPTGPERFLAIERTYAEIAAKKKRKQPLVPNFKK